MADASMGERYMFGNRAVGTSCEARMHLITVFRSPRISLVYKYLFNQFLII